MPSNKSQETTKEALDFLGIDPEVFRGPQGEKGESIVGPVGPKGERGERGEPGKDGKSIVGPKGDRGPIGERGPKGDRGESGKDGKDGKPGKDGRDGKDGKPGKDGKTIVGWGAHPLRIEDDGTLVDKNARVLNFTGGTITRNADGTISIPLGSGGVTDHGALTGLGDNDHTQYVNAVSDTATVNLTLTGQSISADIIASGIDHGGLAGLSDDDHTQYAILLGRSGGQTLIGSTVTAQNLTLRPNSANTTTGAVIINGPTFRGTTNQTTNIGTTTNRFNDMNAAQLRVFRDLSSGGSFSVNSVTATDYGNYIVTASGSDGVSVANLDSTTNAGFSLLSLYNDSPNSTVTVNNRSNGVVVIGGANVYSAGFASAAHSATIDTDTGSGSTWIGYAYVNTADVAANVANGIVTGLGANFLGAIGINDFAGGGGNTVDSVVSGEGATSLISLSIADGTTSAISASNTAPGGLLQGAAVINTQTSHTITFEASGTGGAGARGYISRGVLRATNKASFASANVQATANTGGLLVSGQGAAGFGHYVGSSLATVSGNAATLIANITSTGSGTIGLTGSATFAVVQVSSSGTLTVSAPGSGFIGRINSTGSVSIGGTAGNFGLGDAGTVGIQTTGTTNCVQIGQGANATANSVQFGSTVMVDYGNTRMGIGQTTPTAKLHLGAGSTAASSAPIKLTSGTVMTTAEAGAIEFTTDDFFATITTGTARKAFILDDGARLTSGTVPVATTNGRLIDGLIITSGTYTPTISNNTNITASTAYQCQYMRVGNTVTVSGKVDIEATGAGLYEFGISLPVASNFGATEDCAGTAVGTQTSTTSGADVSYIMADATNDRASVNGDEYDATPHTKYFHFTYQVI